MNEHINEQTATNVQPTEVENGLGKENVEVSLGKFKDVNALMNAYNSLLSEFTKRCQKVKELEDAIAMDKEKSSPIEGGSEKGKSENSKEISITEQDKDEILKGYLKNLLSAKQQAIIMDSAGLGIKTPVEKPKTLEQAAEYAKALFNK